MRTNNNITTVENIDSATHTGLIEVLNNLLTRKDELESEIAGIKEDFTNAGRITDLADRINRWYIQPLIDVVSLTSFKAGDVLVEMTDPKEVINFLDAMVLLFSLSIRFDNIYKATRFILEEQ